MVFVLELDEDESPLSHRRLHESLIATDPSSTADPANNRHSSSCSDDGHEERPNPNLNGFSAALGCYPIVLSLARLLDLNSLHNLSLTCRQIRGTLLLFRDQLVTRTLKCINEEQDLSPAEKLAMRFRESREAWRTGADRMANSPENLICRRITSGKVGKCARDMVGECRRCGVVVCRNCIAKPTATLAALRGRHRRLCHTCRKEPLSRHLTKSLLITTPRSSPRSTPASVSRTNTPLKDGPPLTQSSPPTPLGPRKSSFTQWAFARTPCLCADPYIWLCTSCGHTLHSADTLYARGWTWRTAYSSYVGVCEGNKGVECGRVSYCLATRLVEQEVDCDAAALAALETEAEKAAADGTGKSWSGGGFAAQEMQGIGGMVKMKHRRLVRVGAEVDYEEDEDGEGASKRCLEREVKGEVRSWCAWCERVIPSKEDGWDEEWSLGGC